RCSALPGWRRFDDCAGRTAGLAREHHGFVANRIGDRAVRRAACVWPRTGVPAMSGEIARAVVQGYTAPRASMRQLLDSGSGIEVALGLVALAYLVQAILTILFMSGGFGIGGHLLAMIQQLVTFFVLSMLIQGIGRMAGGTGTLEGAQLVVGWHALVTSLISPLAIGVSTAAFTAAGEGAEGMPPSLALLAFVY